MAVNRSTEQTDTVDNRLADISVGICVAAILFTIGGLALVGVPSLMAGIVAAFINSTLILLTCLHIQLVNPTTGCAGWLNAKVFKRKNAA